MINEPGSEAPKKVNVFIEIPKGSNVKYEYDIENKVIKVDRILHTSMVYPYNYGYVAGTLGEDGDPLDIMVVSNSSFIPYSTIVARPIGALMMKDEEGVDTKVLAVPTEKVEPDFKGVNDVNDLPEHVRDMIGHFFSYYKSIEPGKWAKAEGWKGHDEAYRFINEAIERAKKGGKKHR